MVEHVPLFSCLSYLPSASRMVASTESFCSILASFCAASSRVSLPLCYLVHQVSDWCSGAAANFGWMREAKRRIPRWSLTDERQSGRSKGAQPAGCDENG